MVSFSISIFQFMLSYSQLNLDSILETYLKLKILHLSDNTMSSDKHFLLHNQSISLKIFLKVIYSLRIKKVLSGKLTNRIAINYFKKFFLGSKTVKFEGLRMNKAFLDSNYVITLGINNLYEDFKLISTRVV